MVDERHGLEPAALREMLRRLVEIAQRRDLDGVVVAAREPRAMGERRLGQISGMAAPGAVSAVRGGRGGCELMRRSPNRP